MTSDAPSTSENPTGPEKTGLNDPKIVRILQFAVVAMGVILVIGFLTVLGRIAYLYLGAGNTNVASSHVMANTTPHTLGLPTGARVTSMSLSENRLAVYFEAPTGNGIRVLNTSTGAVESIIHLRPEVPAQ